MELNPDSSERKDKFPRQQKKKKKKLFCKYYSSNDGKAKNKAETSNRNVEKCVSVLFYSHIQKYPACEVSEICDLLLNPPNELENIELILKWLF